jgi:hypothetical protein
LESTQRNPFIVVERYSLSHNEENEVNLWFFSSKDFREFEKNVFEYHLYAEEKMCQSFFLKKKVHWTYQSISNDIKTNIYFFFECY